MLGRMLFLESNLSFYIPLKDRVLNVKDKRKLNLRHMDRFTRLCFTNENAIIIIISSLVLTSFSSDLLSKVCFARP